MGNCLSGRDNVNDLREEDRKRSGDRIRLVDELSKSGTTSIPITPIKSAGPGSVLSKSVTESRLEEDEMIFRQIISATAKEFIDVSTIDNNTPVPAHELRELKRAYRKTIRSTELVVGSVSSFTGLKLPALTTSQSQDSANIPVDRVVAPDEFDSQFLEATATILADALHSVEIKFVGKFVVEWDDEDEQ